MITFNTDDMLPQKFPFPPPIMDYIYKNLTASQLLKLYKTCKFFYAKFRLNIVEDFEICDDKEEERIIGNSIAICLDNPAWSKLNNLWISKSFTYCENDDAEQPRELDNTKFSRMTYTMLDVFGKLSVSEYEFLVKPPALRHLIVNGAICYPDNEMNLSVEEIVERASHVSSFDLSRDYVSQPFPPIDINKLIALNRQTKITSLQICDISKIPDTLLVIEFLKKHAIPDVDYYFGFDVMDFEFDKENVRTFCKTIDDGLQAWKLSLQIPPAISSPLFDLTGKLAVVTGASEGIGKATVILFRQLGASVFAVSRNRGQLKSLIEECQNIKNTGFLHTFYSPYNYKYNIDKIFIRAYYKYDSKFDVLVNNADTFGWGGVPDFDLEQEYCINMRTIVQNQYNLMHAAKECLTYSKGSIINVAYSDGLITRSVDALSIASSKEQIKCISRELKSAGVRINTVNPGSRFALRPERMNDAEYKKFLEKTKNLHDEQVANSIAFLASDAAKALNGSTLNVNLLNLH